MVRSGEEDREKTKAMVVGLPIGGEDGDETKLLLVCRIAEDFMPTL